MIENQTNEMMRINGSSRVDGNTSIAVNAYQAVNGMKKEDVYISLLALP